MELEAAGEYLGDVEHFFARLDEDTVALGLPHLSGGMRSINNVNSRYREGKSGANYTPTLIDKK
ncbi:MAG: hypothetical protein ACETWG_07825, partial [Candidatus Neomarinimicrobiota bacterium]